MNRIATWFDSLDRLIDNSGGGEAALETARLAQCPVTADQPVDLWLERDLLRAVLQASVRQFATVLRRKHLPDNVRNELQAHIAQRRAFMAWLKDEEEHVYVRLHPTRTTEPEVQDA